MSTFRKNIHLSTTNVLRDYNSTYLWKEQLHGFEKKNFKTSCVPVTAFSLNLIESFSDIVKEGVVFEIKVSDYETEDVEVRWFAKVLNVCGYRVLARYIGAESQEKEDFWVNILSNEIYCVGDALSKDPDMKKFVYSPPMKLNMKNESNLENYLSNTMDELKDSKALAKTYNKCKKNLFASKFSVGERIELLNYNDSQQLRPARIQNICGRRLNVLVSKQDFDGEWNERDDDRQLQNKGAEYWIDQESFFIFPVGWATSNGYSLDAKKEYKKHTEKIASQIEKGEQANYAEKDVTPQHFQRPSLNKDNLAKIKVGQKLELIDPLAQQFQDLKVASVLKVLNSEGYVVIGMDGPDAEEDSVPLYVSSPFIFPVGYAKQYGLKLVTPPGYDDDTFNWESYMKTTKSEPLPVELFKPMPSQERLNSFKVGSKLEAADMCENQLVCPASIKEIKGRILNVNFDGWDSEFDELYDIDSHDIFPTGWCEIHGLEEFSQKMASEDKFESVLSTRYCKTSPLIRILSETNKATLWRQLWIWLAESEKELGLKQVTQEAIDEMKKNRDVFEWEFIRSEERKLKHDVMAHNHAFGKDNADLIAYRDSIDHILKRFATVIERLSTFSLNNKDVVTVGRTHYQTASLVTIGKRGVLWAQELLMAFQSLAEFRDKMRFRGIKGATGTQDSFLTLFGNDESKVEELDELVTRKAGFSQRFVITGQTYSRQQDAQLIFSLSLLGAAAKKVCTDIRVLQAFGELLEPFEKDQIGSSAMPYKKNPMKSERCCSLARKLINSPQEALTILADQGLERTLDDSAGRRILIPDCLLTAEALLTTLQNIFEGLTVQTENVRKIVDDEIAFLGLEKAMMMLTEDGVDRQKAHHVIREAALSAKALKDSTGARIDIRQTMADPFFDSVRDRVVSLVENPINFTGRCSSQTVNFVNNEILPTIGKYLDKSAAKVQLDV
ncbi:unnamed protein product [Caenorhabditis angaria]|uniref:Adenylosuccinate lyase C-terminal domain-containing protein n=1 Tax=Caenorhabditis angaria TaxID=860376 RepID=A0A9P1I6D6_9PELO|nr:unnamed protein product [Caenorhabditis angaria]